MDCPTCQTPNEEGAKSCMACGASLEERANAEKKPEDASPSEVSIPLSNPTPEASTVQSPGTPSPTEKKKRDIAKILAFIVGDCLILAGAYMLLTTLGTEFEMWKFGADFYTEIYARLTDVALILVRIQYLLSLLVIGIGAIINFLALRR